MSNIVYKLGVTKTAATLAEHGAGLLTGHIRREKDGSEYVLVQNGITASGTIADGLACGPQVGQTTTGSTTVLKVILTSAATVPVVGFNNTGAVVPGDHFFWAKCRGRGYGLAGGAIADGVGIAPAAAGIITVAGATSPCGYTISDITTNVNNAIWITATGGPGA